MRCNHIPDIGLKPHQTHTQIAMTVKCETCIKMYKNKFTNNYAIEIV